MSQKSHNVLNGQRHKEFTYTFLNGLQP